MPLAMALTSRGWQVTGSKTTPDGVEAARMCGIESCQLTLTPELECDADELEALLAVDALVVTLPASRTVEGGEHYLRAVQNGRQRAGVQRAAHHLHQLHIGLWRRQWRGERA